jgi:DNA (cytosine-5)-methyltransferase 1
MVLDAYDKFKQYPTNRYYLLSTRNSDSDELKKILKYTNLIEKKHGCQVIVNGIIHSLKYYLRLLNNTNVFLEKYANNLNKDIVIKAEQKRLWNQIIKQNR